MGQTIQLDPVVEIEKQQQDISFEDLEKYRQLGVLEVYIFQGDDDEDCELQMLRSMGASDDEVLYAVEAGAALKELREGK